MLSGEPSSFRSDPLLCCRSSRRIAQPIGKIHRLVPKIPLQQPGTVRQPQALHVDVEKLVVQLHRDAYQKRRLLDSHLKRPFQQRESAHEHSKSSFNHYSRS
eukprot:scaffold6167_cov176-Pinguiococcus_pyrenoidosus.AAC.3